MSAYNCFGVYSGNEVKHWNQNGVSDFYLNEQKKKTSFCNIVLSRTFFFFAKSDQTIDLLNYWWQFFCSSCKVCEVTLKSSSFLWTDQCLDSNIRQTSLESCDITVMVYTGFCCFLPQSALFVLTSSEQHSRNVLCSSNPGFDPGHYMFFTGTEI